jgi:hypothetical protein
VKKMTRDAPRGQILVMVAAGFVGLLAIAALVIDLGFVWMERRAQQNAVDPAAVAAARYIEPYDLAQQRTAACFFIQQHGYFSGDPNCATAIADGDLYVGPSTTPPYTGTPYVEVRIRDQHSTIFGGLIGIPTVPVVTGAVAANGGNSTNSNALVALDPTSCGAGMLTGNGVIDIKPIAGTTGGFVYVNSICGIDPVYGTDNDGCENQGGNENDPRGAMHISGTNPRLYTPHLFVRGTCNRTSNAYPTYCPDPCLTTEGAPLLGDTIFGLLEPSHADGTLPERGGRTSCPWPGQLISPGPGCVFEGNAANYPVRLDPGVYYGGWVIRGQAKIELNPGIYYIAGGGIQMAAGSTSLRALDGAGGVGNVLLFSSGDPTYGGSCAPDENWPSAPPVPTTQYSSPTADGAFDGTWAGTYEDIDEFTADDADFIASPSSPNSANFFEFPIGGVDTPASLNNVVLRYRYQKSAGAGETIDLTVELRQGTNVIASQTHTAISGAAWTEGSIQLTNAQAATITDWYDLRVRVRPVATGGADAREAQVSWIRMEVPPGSGVSPARRCQGKIEMVGGTELSMKATDIAPWAGLVMWQDGTLAGNGRATNPIAKVDIGGQGKINIGGTVYGPKAECYLRGNGASNPADKTAAVQMICWRFTIVGNGGLNIPFDANQIFGNNRKGLVH